MVLIPSKETDIIPFSFLEKYKMNKPLSIKYQSRTDVSYMRRENVERM